MSNIENQDFKNEDGSAIVITGIGIISPAADSIAATLETLKNKKSAIKKLEKNDYGTMPVGYGGEIAAEYISKYKLDPIKFKGFQSYIHCGVIAARNALCDAGLFDASGRGSWIYGGYEETMRGAFVSSGVNGNNAEALFEAFSVSGDSGGGLDIAKFAATGAGFIHPKWILTALSNNLIFFITSEFGLKGDNNNTAFSAAGGAYMLAAAERAIREGACDMAVVCGADSIVNWQAVDELVKLGILNDKHEGGAAVSMPAYTAGALGALPSEGAAALVLERKKTAAGRGARIYAEISGCAQYCEGTGGAPSGGAEGFVKVFEALHRSAKLTENDNILLNLNAASISGWDNAELKGLEILSEKYPETFGKNIKLTGLKPYFGHTFSASFVMETAVAAAALESGLAYGLPHETGAPAGLNRLFENDFGGGKSDKSMVITACIGGNYAGVALEKLQA
ncbi:MAG TPA: hypothetical protein DC017_18465 [Candidatus Wallbacteria bacterium]|nr:hypothetical protein [Candidatus Wallbacteria bacterium]